jgi:hypothetical protein
MTSGSNAGALSAASDHETLRVDSVKKISDSCSGH